MSDEITSPAGASVSLEQFSSLASWPLNRETWTKGGE